MQAADLPQAAPADPATLTHAGDRITVKPSCDRAHVFVQVANDLENIVIALPRGAVPFVITELARAVR